MCVRLDEGKGGVVSLGPMRQYSYIGGFFKLQLRASYSLATQMASVKELGREACTSVLSKSLSQLMKHLN